MLASPKKRSCPSCIVSNRSNVRRQPWGESNGNRPSKTSMRASAAHSRSLSKSYFRPAGAGAGAEPRNDLKNSDADGSSTTTSLFLLKLAL